MRVLGSGVTRNKKGGMLDGVYVILLGRKSCLLFTECGGVESRIQSIQPFKMKNGKLRSVCAPQLHAFFIHLTYLIAAEAHKNYWDQYPGKYEHWRFELGFNIGWSDAFLFFEFSPGASNAVSELGFIGEWAKRRSVEHVREKGKGNIWEFGMWLFQCLIWDVDLGV